MKNKLNLINLENRLGFLEKNKRFIQDSLEDALTLGDFQEVINSNCTPEQVFEETEKRINHLINFEAKAFCFVNQNNADLTISFCEPENLRPYMRDEIEFMIDKQFIAWAMREKRGVTVLSKNQNNKIFLHVIQTYSRIRGLFVGVFPDLIPKVKDASFQILSIVLRNAANALESLECYNFMRERKQLLQTAVDRRTKEVLSYERQLQQAQKSEAIATLAGGIAHDFNNILSAIMGYTELSMIDAEDNSPIKRHLDEIYKASFRARDMVQQILAYSRNNDLKRIPVQIGPIVKEALKMLRSFLPTTIEIKQNIESDVGYVEANVTQIHQVLMNLCTNAFHAMRENKGVLKVTLTKEVSKNSIISQYEELAPEGVLRLTVKDTGHGMTAQTIERIFDPYFTTKSRGKGTGLGLAVVQGIIKAHGGVIVVESEVGKGSAFHILLPMVEAEDRVVETTKESLPEGQEHILFVDDEETLIELGKQMLERLGYKPVVLTSSVDALELFRKDPYRFDLVITDMTMPKMTGDELSKALLNIRADIPIILCSGYSENITPDQVKDLGIKSFLTKPLVIKDLAHQVRRVLIPN